MIRSTRRACFVLVVLLAITVPLLAGDWPQIFGPLRNSVSTEKGLLTTWPDKGPAVIWERNVGEGYSGPVIAGDRLILFHRVDKEDLVECLDASTGKPQWKQAFATDYSDPLGKGDGPRSTPVIVGQQVFTLGPAGRLACLELKTGKVTWERDLAAEYKLRRNYFGIGSTPIVEGGLIVLNLGARDAGIVALNKDTGKEVWKATDDDASYASPVAATIGGKRQLIFFTREGLVGLDPKDGKVLYTKRWRARIDASVNAASPIVFEDQIFLTSSYQTGAVLLKVSGADLETVWKGQESLSCHYTTPVLVDGVLYGLDGRQESGTQLRAVDWKTGKVRWTEEGINSGSLVAIAGHLLVLSEDGKLRLVEASPTAYHEIAAAKVLAGPCRAPIALAQGNLYARGRDKLICLKVTKD